LPESYNPGFGPSLVALRWPVGEAFDVRYWRNLPFDVSLGKGSLVPLLAIPSSLVEVSGEHE